MDLSIDIEGLSLKPNALVLSIGVVPFCVADSKTFEGRYFVLNHHEQKRKGRDVDPDTVAWWIDQALHNPGAADVFTAPRQQVEVALYEFQLFVQQTTQEGGEIWFNGPQYDQIVLESLLRDFGMSCPWKYSKVRDMRTLRYLLARLNDIEDPMELGLAPNMLEHDALSDADWQARYIMRALKLLGVET